MNQKLDLNGLEAARQLAALSPETQSRFDESMLLGQDGPMQVYLAFDAIGRAIGSKRQPISEANLKRLFGTIEQLLCDGDGEVSNAIATCTLERISACVEESNFDFSTVDPFLGTETRRNLVAWDDLNKVTTPGLRRR